MKQPKVITVKYGPTQDSVLNGECTGTPDHFQTVKEAKAYAKYTLTQDWADANESSTVQGYSQVCVNGECVADYFSKDLRQGALQV